MDEGIIKDIAWLAERVEPNAIREKTKAKQSFSESHLAIAQQLHDLLTSLGERIQPARDHLMIHFAEYYRAAMHHRAQHGSNIDFTGLLIAVDEAIANDDKQSGHLIHHIGDEFSHIFIDEFQDNDPLQWRIFSRCFQQPKHHVCIIGDPKQSIYRFRGADLDTYLAARSSCIQQFALDTNFRSDPGVSP